MEVRVEKLVALEQLAADRAAETELTQRAYAKSWGVSTGTANAWIRSAEAPKPTEQELNTATEHAERVTEQTPEQTEQTELLARISEQLNTISEQLNTFLGLAQFLASSNSLLFNNKTPSSLRSEGAPQIEQTEQLNTEQTEQERSTEQPEQTEQPSLIELPARDRLTPPGPTSKLLNYLQGKIPQRLDGTASPTKSSWLDENWPLIASEAQSMLDDDASEKQFEAKAKSVMFRFWKNKTPPKRSGARAKVAPPAREIFDWKNHESAEGASS